MFWVDSATPPSLVDVQNAKAAGMVAWGGYVGGPWAAVTWNKTNFDTIRSGGLQPVFIYVGVDPSQAVSLAQACGIQHGEILVQDVEAGWTTFWTASQVQTVRAPGYRACLYALASDCNNHGSVYDLEWAAQYGPQPTPTDRRSYQYWNSHSGFGLTVDQSVCTPAWLAVPEDVMDMNTARGLAYTNLAGLLGYNAQTPDIVQAIEAYAVSILGNVEGGISALITDAQRNPAFIPARVAKLEQEMGSLPAPDATLAQRVTTLETNIAAAKAAL